MKIIPVHNNPIEEAQRYMKNAREILSEKAGKIDDLYSDPKYIKMAGNTAWSGVLVALDGTLRIKENKGRKRVDIADYMNAVAKKDKKMAKYLTVAYDSLHKSLGYDGILGYKFVQAALGYGDDVIKWAEKNYQKE